MRTTGEGGWRAFFPRFIEMVKLAKRFAALLQDGDVSIYEHNSCFKIGFQGLHAKIEDTTLSDLDYN